MTTIDSLKNWLEVNLLDHIIWDEYTFTIKEVGKFLIIRPKNEPYLQDEIVLNRDLELQVDNLESQILMEDEEIGYFAFQFGNRWYYSEEREVKEFVELKYLGKAKDCWEEPPAHLGIHGAMDLCNGSGDYTLWCKKANFFNIKTLGIAEENTLAGVLAFQNACGKAKIKSIIGETVTVKDKEEEIYNVKLYCANEKGWRNLLLINSHLNVINNKFILEEQLFKHAEGLICILTPEIRSQNKLFIYEKASFVSLFYQFDLVRWDSEERDKRWLLSLQEYLERGIKKIEPILITDSYYLEKYDAKIRRDLNSIGKLSFKSQSADQYFKHINTISKEFAGLFKEEDHFEATELWARIQRGLQEFEEKIDFKIPTDKLHLPKYQMSPEEAVVYSTNEDLFWALIAKGMEDKEADTDEYYDRVEKEAKVIVNANLVDYFLIVWDFLNWARGKGIKTGYGRGSAGGCMIAYLLDIVHVNPFDYGLIFERFLNEGRLYKTKKAKGYRATHDDGSVIEAIEYDPEWDRLDMQIETGVEIEIKVPGSMPDIDNDIAGERREEVKRYLEDKYGKSRVAGIGTYGTFKIKGILKDFARRYGADTALTNYVTGAIQDDSLSYAGLFKYGQTVPIIKTYIQDHPELIERIPLVIDQPKTASQHAAGIIIVPESPNGIYDQLPVKIVDGVLISEWPMEDIEQAGFLKIDILGLRQLDKFADIIELIKENTGKEIELTEIPLDDPKVFKLFGKGNNEDVFQFQGFGLRAYTQELKPKSIEDLIATVALYRPGPIDTKAHMQYVHRKNGDEKVIYPYGTEEILKETYGVYCYQEQIQKIAEIVAGFTPNEADDIRKAIGKKLPELMAQYKERFVEGVVNHGGQKSEAEFMWTQIEVFGGYSFNKSHAACYGITGYHSQWFKANYPLEFWTVSLRYSAQDNIPSKLSEIYMTSEIRIAPPDINKSGRTFEMDKEKNTIYWTISSTKQVGEVSMDDILKERDANGQFFSVEEFAKRMKGTGVNKRTIINLIFAGAFDELHNVQRESERYPLLIEYLGSRKEEIDEEICKMKKWRDYQWIMKQKELSGFGILDFRKIIHHTSLVGKIGNYRPNKEILETAVQHLPSETVIGGLITKFDIRGDRPFGLIEINDGSTILNGVIWSDTYLQYKDQLQDPIDKMIVLSAEVKFDKKYKFSNVFNTTKATKLEIVDQ